MEGTWGRRVFLLIAGERLAGSIGGPGGILLGTASFLPQPVPAPGAYFLSDETPPAGAALSPGKDDDGRRDGTRLKAPSSNSRHADDERSPRVGLAPARLRSSCLLPRAGPPPSTFRTVSAGVPQDVVFLVRVCRAFVKMFWRADARGSRTRATRAAPN